MKIAIDSNDLPAATRLDTWRWMLCDTFIGMDCHLPGENFRSVIGGYAVGDHLLMRVKSSRHAVDRSPTLIKRDGLELVFFGMLLDGRCTINQGGRETVLERGTVVLSDTSRPFRTHVDASADILWLAVPKKPMAERVRGIEDLAAIALKPAEPIEGLALGLMAGFEEAWSRGTPPHAIDRLTTNVLDTLAMTITSSGLPPARPPRRALVQ